MMRMLPNQRLTIHGKNCTFSPLTRHASGKRGPSNPFDGLAVFPTARRASHRGEGPRVHTFAETAMGKKSHVRKPAPASKPTSGSKHRDSVFKEAWENMNEDMARVMPGFLAKRLHGRKGKAWVLVVITLVELVVLGVVGKVVYDWFVNG